MQGEGLITDRTGTAVTLGVVGGAIGGSLVGTSIIGLGYATPGQPYLSMVAGFLVIAVSTILAGWYLPSAEEIVQQWNEQQMIEKDNWDTDR